MPKLRIKLSTGLPALDHVFRGLMPGDNIVWQVESIRDYLPFIPAYAAYAKENRQKIFYFRFAQHPPLLEPGDGAEIITLNPDRGFEPFLSEIHRVINEEGRGCLYLFDCLSELAPDWCSDRMLGNFFMLTCPYLYDRAAIAYFAILRNYHSFHALKPIASTTQILVDVYRHRETLYIQPLKVQYRYSPTMYMLHAWEPDDTFTPVNQSSIITEILANAPWSRSESASAPLGYWTKTFAVAQEIQDDLDHGKAEPDKVEACFQKILRMLISHDAKVLALAEKYLTLRDLLAIRRRMIGTGLIGGKAVGMILARAILRNADPARWGALLEMHDSFFVGADVFYTYLVQNGCWWMIHHHRTIEGPDDDTETARRRIHAGDFPDYIVKQYADMLDYFGQSPIIVRSSSLLEDNFGNAFAGKYESVFCANQGGAHKRLEDFLFAVRTVYASTMGEEALAYRQGRGLMQQDEQMGLLIQRVSGNAYGSLFFPQAAGVGFSFNPYVWDHAIEPSAGMLRLVFGMGTRAVDRSDDDYTRIVALNAPTKRPESSISEVVQYAQRRVDVLDLEANHLASVLFEDIGKRGDIPLSMFASKIRERDRESGRALETPWILTFDRLLTETPFVQDMKDLLRTLQHAYHCPVDVEFTLNFVDHSSYKINLVQCRPLQVRGAGEALGDPPESIPHEDVLLESRGAVIGNSAELPIDWVVYVAPSVYGVMRESERYSVARLIGEITHQPALAGRRVMLLGPGRWGTATPSLGVPVSFVDIAGISVLGEIVAMRENLVPDVSLGTHFFNELVEREILYLALFPGKPGNALNSAFFEDPGRNRLLDLLPGQAEWANAVRLIDASALDGGGTLILNANALRQRAVCYRQPPRPEDVS